MYELEYSGQFKKDLKRCISRGCNPASLQVVLDLLQANGELPQNYRPHRLSGKFAHYWECHIESDWLLIYDVKNTIKLVSLARTGTHSDLFK